MESNLTENFTEALDRRRWTKEELDRRNLTEELDELDERKWSNFTEELDKLH